MPLSDQETALDKQEIIDLIRAAFLQTDYPGDGFLLGSREGDDAFEAVQPFRDVADWSDMDPEVLDHNYDALSLLSDGGFRFFLPAYLIADLNDQLRTADPVFHLTGGFRDTMVSIPLGGIPFEKRIGRAAFVNPRRYGAMMFEDYARYRLSVFTREEARAIVSYLEYRQAVPDSVDGETIDAALGGFWRERAESAPPAEALADHLRAEEEFMRRISEPPDDPG